MFIQTVLLFIHFNGWKGAECFYTVRLAKLSCCFLAWRQMPFLLRQAWCSEPYSLLAAPLHKSVLPVLSHLHGFLSLILTLILFYVSCGSGTREAQEQWPPCLKGALMAMGKTTGCGTNTCTGVTKEGKTSGSCESLQLGCVHRLLLWRWWSSGRVGNILFLLFKYLTW